MIPIFNISRGLWKGKPQAWGNVADVQSGLFHNAEKIGVDPASLKAAYPLWENAGDIVHNYGSVAGHNGTLISGANWKDNTISSTTDYDAVEVSEAIDIVGSIGTILLSHRVTSSLPSYLYFAYAESYTSYAFFIGGLNNSSLLYFSNYSIYNTDVANEIKDGNLHQLGCTYTYNDSWSLFLDCHKKCSGGLGDVFSVTSGDKLHMFGRDDATQRYTAGESGYCIFCSEILPDSVIAEIQDNPYQLWQPRTPVFYSFEAAGGTTYTRGNYATLPTDTTDLETSYSSQDNTDVAAADGVRVTQNAIDEYAVHQFKDEVLSSSCTVTLTGQSDLACSESTIYLQIYNHNTTSWETIDSDNTTAANTNFTLTADMNDLTNYKDGNSIVTCRIWQLGV